MKHRLTRRRLLAAGLSAVALAGLRDGRAAGRTVTDMLGRRVALPNSLDRIASAGGSPAVNAFLFLFGLGERLVTGLPAAFQSSEWRLQRVFSPGLDSKPVVSGPPPAWTPNVEALLTLRPDISFVVSDAAAALLERGGLPTVVLQWDRVDSIARTVTLLAEVFDDGARAQRYVAWEADLLARVRRLVGEPAHRPRVLYMRYGSLTQPIMVPANHLIAAAGGESVTARDNPLNLDVFPFSMEQLLTWQPEAVLLASASEVPKLLADPRLAEIPAVRDRHVFVVPHGAHIWTHYTPEQPLGVLWLAQQLFPDRLASFDLKAETQRFYRTFFGHALSNADLGALLNP